MKKTIRIIVIAAICTGAYMYLKPATIDPSLIAETTDVTTGTVDMTTGTTSNANQFSLNANSTLSWTGRKVGGEHYGTIALKDGFVTLESGMVAAGEFTIDMATIASTDLSGADQEKLVWHLSSADFFDVAQYPTGRFTITSITANASGASMYDVVGTLMIKWTGKQITFPATIVMMADSVNVTAWFYIDRKDRGLTTMAGVIDDKLGINFNLMFGKAL